MNTFALMSYAVVVAAVLSVVGRSVERMLMAFDRPRRWAWCGTLIVSVVLTIGAMLLPRTSPVSTVTAASAPALPTFATEQSQSEATGPSLSLAWSLIQHAERQLAVLAGMERLWNTVFTGSLLIIPTILLVQYTRLRARRRRWTITTLDASPVFVSHDFGPAVVGLRTPSIVVPAFVLDLPTAQQQLIVAHEREHLHAHDGRLSFAMILVLALTPWNLPLWWQYARLRAAIELDCDTRVLRRGVPPHAYGTVLLDMAARLTAQPIAASALVARLAGSVRERIELIAGQRQPVSRGRTFGISVVAMLGIALAVGVPRPVVSQRLAPVQPRGVGEAQDDSIAIRVMYLNRAGKFAEAERVGLERLGTRTDLRSDGAACAVLIGVTFAQTRQQKSDAARSSMSRFDRECSNAVFSDFFPAEANRVRRVVAGESADAVYRAARSAHVVTTGGATDVMMLNREGRHAEAEAFGVMFLAVRARTPREPEACAVLIGVTHAQHAQGQTTVAKNSLARFDRDCTGVTYLDWFPAETERVRARLAARNR